MTSDFERVFIKNMGAFCEIFTHNMKVIVNWGVVFGIIHTILYGFELWCRYG